MRMRRKKNLDSRIDALRHLLIEEPIEACRQRMGELTPRPVYVEVGCGKGRFVTEMAAQNPDSFFVAVEKYENVLVQAMERAAASELENVLFLGVDAARLTELFGSGQVAAVYINFPDPWPENRRAKRRLTHRNMLAVFSAILAPGGEIRLKTDNRALFEFSLCELSQSGFELLEVSLDLHSTGKSNVMTEYETVFSGQGMKILALTARKKG